jgi:ribosomal protein S1
MAGMSEHSRKEWESLCRQFPAGTEVSGVVTRVELFGAFVRLDQMPDVTALLEVVEIGEFSRTLNYPEDYPFVGQSLRARILGWPARKFGQLRLTQRP